MPGGLKTEIHLGAEDTDGAFCLLVDHPPAGWSLPAHRHKNEAESMYVLEGEFEIDVEGTVSRVSAGQALHVPRGVVHSGGNIGETTGRRVLVFTPGGVERFLVEVGVPDPGIEIDLDAAASVASRYGFDFLGQP
jgi:quercetin dioxygenase-like cupin family protein